MLETNKSLVIRLFDEVMNKKNLAIINELVSADYINHSPRIGRVGREEFVQDTTRFLTAFPDWQTTIDDIIAEGDKVVVRRTVHGTHRGDIPGIPMIPTEKRSHLQCGTCFASPMDR